MGAQALSFGRDGSFAPSACLAFVLASMLLLFGTLVPADGERANALVFAYSDFGPPSLASDTIGPDWWQWDHHGNSRPATYPVNVVVYRGMPLWKVKQRYPVLQERRQDFRYLEYSEAVEYLDKAIQDTRGGESDTIRTLNNILRTTRMRLFEGLGKPRDP